MVKILGRNIGGSPEKRGRLTPTPREEDLLRDLQEEGKVTEYPSIVPKDVAAKLRAVHQRTGDQRFRVGGIGK